MVPWRTHIDDAIFFQRVTGCILSNVNTPSTTPVIGQPQNQTPPIYRNHNNMNHKPSASESDPSAAVLTGYLLLSAHIKQQLWSYSMSPLTADDMRI